ncbi:hypothetical protein KM043_000005 [Ampulex compressa]|nr:hypothetical protein KM043_000005 [Ampulex compressa]
MSIDLFGRQLKSVSSDTTRGPPGLGFKLTSDGHFDLENKRLCIVADATDLQDAVNVKVLRKVVSDELENFFTIINAQKREIDEISSNNQLIYTDIEQKLLSINKNISTLSLQVDAIEKELLSVKKNGEQA